MDFEPPYHWVCSSLQPPLLRRRRFSYTQEILTFGGNCNGHTLRLQVLRGSGLGWPQVCNAYAAMPIPHRPGQSIERRTECIEPSNEFQRRVSTVSTHATASLHAHAQGKERPHMHVRASIQSGTPPPPCPKPTHASQLIWQRPSGTRRYVLVALWEATLVHGIRWLQAVSARGDTVVPGRLLFEYKTTLADNQQEERHLPLLQTPTLPSPSQQLMLQWQPQAPSPPLRPMPHAPQLRAGTLRRATSTCSRSCPAARS